MTLHFAYGSNMSRALMRRRCRGARALGQARLDGWRFIITRDGFASMVCDSGSCVHGVLWALTPRDVAALNAYEQRAYLRRTLPVRLGSAVRPALVYLSPSPPGGRPSPGYQELVLASARDWQLPEGYVAGLERWVPGLHAKLHVSTGMIG
ncbi:MAG TPA: gamma-glutamylcyclotransferase family protein [Xanthobacteraceae bacterium]|nr:gamma-glutamylcyclotransferase family protein [Xanthobacteraceae bacterium]